MKQAKRPTLNQKLLLRAKKLDPDNWLVINESNRELLIQHKLTDRARRVIK